ncbi:hypothetical protein BH09PSE4_BH09PSE4_07990 [soil metagenome]
MAWRTILVAMMSVTLAQAFARADDFAASLTLPIASQLTGAQNAPRFAWVENAAGVRNIWAATKGAPARRLTDYTADDGQQIYDLTLTRDGGSLAYVRGGDDEFPDDQVPNTASAVTPPKQQVFVISGGTPFLVGEGHAPAFDASGTRLAFTHHGEIWLREDGVPRKLATVNGDVSDLQWSPDGTRLLFVDNRGDHSFIALLDIAAARLTYLDPGLGFAVEPVFSPDGSQIAFIAFIDPPTGAKDDSGPYWSLRIADAASGATRILWSAPKGPGSRYAGTRGRNLFWSASGAIVFPWEASGFLHAYAIDAAKGGAPRDLTPGDAEAERFVPAADGTSLLFTSDVASPDRWQLWSVPLAGGKPVQLTRSGGIQTYPTSAGNALAMILSDESHPAHVALVGPVPVALHDAPALASFVMPERVSFRAEDGLLIHGQLFRAKGPGKHPALIFVHGGPHRQMLLGFHPGYYYSNAYVLNQHFAGQGYDVLSVNYRSGTGYGRAFRDAPGIARDGATEYRDVLAGGRWLAAQGDVDPARIGIWGGSWGGYLTALALARNSDLFAAGVDFHGVHAMVRPVEKTLSPDQEAAAHQLQWSSSPMGAIETWRSPVLLIHGDDDKSVDFYQSLLLARALTARGVPYRQLVFPNERHEFFRYADWLAAYRAADAFLEDTLMHKDVPK